MKEYSFKRKLVNFYSEFMIFLRTGQSWFLDLRYPIMIAIALKVYLPNASILQLSFIVIAIIISLVILGMIDLKFLKVSQRVAQIMTERYNPYFRNLKLKLSSKNKKFK